ncbi:Uu.00g091940.m01.CDS01 [Anthostomella pinea]|uniref:Uu.00g091940.m01.CDS01 n=1 Tax=Anthostomella pinea TaxID=933095 RepID=A0AAI8VN98_9PEZI|nr:Uu.00g091940.m01.CDS01 [Anthostomella pinea]
MECSGAKLGELWPISNDLNSDTTGSFMFTGGAPLPHHRVSIFDLPYPHQVPLPPLQHRPELLRITYAFPNYAEYTISPSISTPVTEATADMAAKGDKIEKIIARLQQRISEGQFYEAQQQTRVVAARYTKASNWTAAIDIIYNVAQSLLKAGEGGSGGDLCVLLVDVYNQAELKPDSATKGKLLTCLRLFPSEEPTRKKYITAMIAWSSKFGEYPAGDPEFHHVAGSLYAQEHDPFDAEKHLILGTKDSPEVLASMEYKWFTEDEAHTAPLYASRAVLPYLLAGNVRAANTFYRLFTSALNQDKQGQLNLQDVSSNTADMRVYPSIPLLNFLGLLLLAVQRGTADLYRQLKAKYAGHLKELEIWNEPLEMIAEMYFGISRPRQSNPLMDMMSGFFGGGAPASGGPKRPAVKAPTSMPTAEGLD